MQWPPTKPGQNGNKFHFVPAACSTAWVSMPMRLKMIANSLIRSNIEVALGVLDNLGGLCHLYARSLVRAGPMICP